MKRRRRALIPVALILVALLAAAAAAVGEPDWFTRVKEKGLATACREEVARHEKGVLEDSLHVGECYYELGRHEEGLQVFMKLLESPDRNYAAAALVKVGEGQFHLGRKAEAKKTFESCLEQHPDAWYEGSIAERSRAWLKKLAGKLVSPEPPPDAMASIEQAKKEIRELETKLAELRKLLQELLSD